MKKTIAESIKSKIKKGEVTMRSQVSIWAEKWGLNGGIIGIVSSLILLVGFILYWTTENNDLLVGGYGLLGFSSFLQSFPYLFVFIFIVLFLCLVLLFRRYDFSYKKPFLVFLFLVVSGVILLGWISIQQPLAQGFYRREGRKLHMGSMNNRNAVTGIVTEINKNDIVILNDSNELIVIQINSDTHYPFGTPKVGDEIRVVGTWEGVQFSAVGVRVFDESNPTILMPGMMRGPGQGRRMMHNR